MEDVKRGANSAGLRCRNGVRVPEIKEYGKYALDIPEKMKMFSRAAKEFLPRGSLSLQPELLASGILSQSAFP